MSNRIKKSVLTLHLRRKSYSIDSAECKFVAKYVKKRYTIHVAQDKDSVRAAINGGKIYGN